MYIEYEGFPQLAAGHWSPTNTLLYEPLSISEIGVLIGPLVTY